MKKILALVVAMLLVVASIAAIAETTVVDTKLGSATRFSVTVTKDATDKAAHTYGAFQIFKGDLAETKSGDTVTKKVLSNIQWGDSIDSTKLVALKTALNAIDGITVATDATAEQVADAISDAKLANDSDKAQAIADAFNAALTTTAINTVTVTADANSGVIDDLPAGYYLVKDTADVDGEGAKTRFMLEVVSNVSVTEKANVPSVTKKVKEKNDTTGQETDWQDAADYDIGDSVPFKLEGTLPGKFAEYDTYTTYTFTDTLSAGLTAPTADGITIKVGDTDVKSHFNISITGDAKAEQTIVISLKSGEDLKKWTEPALTSASKFVVEYSAVLNDAAVIGTPGNPNKVKLTFSNNPNYDSDGDDTGDTPEDKVVVFTYKITALKVEPDGTGIDATAYEALSVVEKANYVKIGDKYFQTKALTGAGFTLYKKVPTTVDASGWKAVGEEIKGVTTFEFKGTDAGEYKLVETTVPAGFNKAADIEIKVEATYDTDAADPKLLTLTVTPETAGFTVTTTKESDDNHITTDGNINGKVVNQSGSTLPSTGGIGTTIFYIGGGILVVLAGILLVTKRRMKAED